MKFLGGGGAADLMHAAARLQLDLRMAMAGHSSRRLHHHEPGLYRLAWQSTPACLALGASCSELSPAWASVCNPSLPPFTLCPEESK